MYKKNGFTLVEIIIAIAILTVISIVLTPSLINKVEDARCVKDEKIMNDLVESIETALADDEAYTQLSHYFAGNGIAADINYSCYSDGSEKTNITNNIVYLDAEKKEWYYNDKARVLDEIKYCPSGQMYGVTITFTPDKKGIINIKNARINELIIGKNIFNNTNTNIYNAANGVYKKISLKFGEKIKLTSKTYRCSDFTVFVYAGNTASSTESVGTAMSVYGQWSGTNLSNNSATATNINKNPSK